MNKSTSGPNSALTKLFSKEDAAKNFYSMAELFYNRNFSTAAKSEIELLMFSFYMDALISRNKNNEDLLDYSACSDYEIGKELGITQERVRTLKIKKQARYRVDFDWRNSLASLKDCIRYDEVKKKIIIPTPDPNLYNEIRNYIEQAGGYIEIQRKGNYIQIRPEYYLMLIYENLAIDQQKEAKDQLIKEIQKYNKDQRIPDYSTKAEMINQLLNTAGNITSIIAAVIKTLDSPLATAIKSIKAFSI